MKRSVLSVFISAVFVLFSFVVLSGCSDDGNNPVNNNGSEHFHAVGVKLVQSEADIIVSETADSADVVGLIELNEGETSPVFEVWFLNDEGEWFYPGDNAEDHQDHTLELVLGNGDLLGGSVDGWTITLDGLEHGSSWIRLKVFHIDHYGFISPHLRTRIEHTEGSHGAPVGMYLIAGTDTLVTANASNEVTGQLDLSQGEYTDPIDSWFFDENDVCFQPGEDHWLEITINDDTIASSDSLDVWQFRILGDDSGTTTARFRIMHGDHFHYSSPDIPIIVD